MFCRCVKHHGCAVVADDGSCRSFQRQPGHVKIPHCPAEIKNLHRIKVPEPVVVHVPAQNPQDHAPDYNRCQRDENIRSLAEIGCTAGICHSFFQFESELGLPSCNKPDCHAVGPLMSQYVHHQSEAHGTKTCRNLPKRQIERRTELSPHGSCCHQQGNHSKLSHRQNNQTLTVFSQF